MLYKHQIDTINQAPNKWGIWHDVGTGKTITCLMLAQKQSGLTLIVTTKSLKENWRRELEKWWTAGPNRILLMSKEEFRRDWDNISPCNCAIFDEAHFFGNYTSQMHKNALKYINKAKPHYVYLATATPILSSVMSVWALSKLLGNPLSSFMSFQKKYFNMIRMGARFIPVQKSNIEEQIAGDLRKIGSVVSKEEAVDLPEVVHEFEYFTLTTEQKRAIKDLDNDPTSATPIVYHTKCLQIANGTLKTPGGYLEVRSEKMSRLVELVEQYKKCVVVCRQTAELEILHNKLRLSGITSAIYNGSTPVEEREKIIEATNKGECVMLGQADMLIGFNLVGISLMIFYSHSYDYIKYYQSLGRIHRIGQVNKCTYIHMVTLDTVDEAVWGCLERKESFDIALYNRNKEI